MKVEILTAQSNEPLIAASTLEAAINERLALNEKLLYKRWILGEFAVTARSNSGGGYYVFTQVMICREPHEY